MKDNLYLTHSMESIQFKSTKSLFFKSIFHESIDCCSLETVSYGWKVDYQRQEAHVS